MLVVVRVATALLRFPALGLALFRAANATVEKGLYTKSDGRQRGCMKRDSRKQGPDVWQFR